MNIGSSRLAKRCIAKYELSGDASFLFPLIELIRITPEYHVHESYEFLFKIYIETGNTSALDACMYIHPNIPHRPNRPRAKIIIPTTPRKYDFWGNLISV